MNSPASRDGLPLQRHQPEILDKVGECTYDTKTFGPLPAMVAPAFFLANCLPKI